LTFLAGMLALTFPPEMHRVEEILYARRWDGTVALLEIALAITVALCRRIRSGSTRRAGMLARTWPPEMPRVSKILYVRRLDGTVALLEIVLVYIVAQSRRTRSVTTKLAGSLAQTWLPGTHHVKAILHVHKQAGKTVPLEIVQVYIVAPCR